VGLCVVQSRTLVGLEALPVSVEVHLANGLPSLTLVGLADTEVKEARERVRSAILNAGLEWPHNKRITVNLAPADLPKESGRFDLPIALGILAASGQIDGVALAGHEFAGELSLSGALRPIRGALCMGLAFLRAAGADQTVCTALVLPPVSAEEAALVRQARVYRARHLLDVVRRFAPSGMALPEPAHADGWVQLQGNAAVQGQDLPDLADVKGQAGARRALEIAAAGAHSLLMSGPPGSGKSMLAQRLPGILPALDDQQALEAAAVASLAGRFRPQHWGQRPFSAPHHSASATALVGGGNPPRPGEISLAHHGVLFLDELPEFPRAALEALREPLESGQIRISRAARQTDFPARFQLVAAMNPCPCGYLGASHRACRCTPDQVQRYQGKLSGPLLDRIDLHVEVPLLPPGQLLDSAAAEASAAVRARVAQARQRALQRQGHANHTLHGPALQRHAALEPAAAQLLQQAATRLGWSGRATHRALRVARTIADLAASERIHSAHLAEAVQYRQPGHL
jgi:magnesium chelatase family protein